jgi:hypothetical protein
MNKKGERIQGMLLDPDRNDIVATEWLLLHIIRNNKKLTFEFIDMELKKMWRRIHKHNPKFFLTFPKSNDGHKVTEMTVFEELMRFYDIGIIDIIDIKINERRKEGNPIWGITAKGERVFKEWWPRVKKSLPSIEFNE